MAKTSVSWIESVVHHRDDEDWGQFIVPSALLGLSLNDVTGIEQGSIDVKLLSKILHLYDDMGAIVESTVDIKDRCSVLIVVCCNGGIHVLNRLYRQCGYDRFNEVDEDVRMIGIGKHTFEAKVRCEWNVFGH